MQFDTKTSGAENVSEHILNRLVADENGWFER